VSDEPSEPNQQVNIEVGSVSASDNATINIAGGHIIQAAAGATVIIGASAGAGLQALSDLVQLSPEVRGAVASFSVDFEAATSQVDVMGDYKDLHDLLHQTQFHCYAPILREATRFPDETSLELLEDYERSLRDILVQLGNVSTRSDQSGHKNIAEADVAFIQELQQAHDNLKAALVNSDPEPLKKCIWRMKRILTKVPVVIDTRLNAAARTLRLSELVGALAEISKVLNELKIDPAKVEKFNEGFSMLQNMDQRLNILLTDHEKWQSIDIEMRRIDSLIEQDLTELEMSWDDLKVQFSPLYLNLTEAWAVSIQGYANQLDQFLAANNPAKIRQAFRNFRHESASHFFQVDLNLKALCSELRLIGEPLTAIVRRLE
jgi:hypothetical protein